MQNVLIAVGAVKSVAEDWIVLKGTNNHKLPLVAYNLQVKASILGRDSDFMILVGNVFTSTEHQMKLADLNTLEQYERRNFFRINVKVPMQLELDLPIGAEEVDDSGEVIAPPLLHATMLDVSLGGCLIETDADLTIGAVYIVHFVLLQVQHEVRARVRRVAGEQDEHNTHMWKYGCIFESNSERKMDAICKDLFALQRKAIHNRLRD